MTGATQAREAGRVLFGRAEQSAALDAAIDAPASGRSAVVVVEGAWGTGKSALLDRTCRRAEAAGLVVVSAVGVAPDRELELGVVHQVLEQVLDIFPEGIALHRVVATVAAERPVLLVVDDAHDIDAASARELVRLLARVDRPRVGVVIAGAPRRRPGWDELRAAAARRSGTRFVRLAPLDARAGASLVRHRVPAATDDEVAELHRVSAGNPFLLRAAADAVVAGAPADGLTTAVPDAIRHRVAALLHELEAPTRRLVEVASVDLLTRQPQMTPTVAVAPAVLASMLELDDAALARCVDELADVGLIAQHDLGSIAPLTAAAIAAEMSATRREAVHRALANELWSSGAANDVVVDHLLRSSPGHSAWAVGMLRAAADEARGRGDLGAASALLRRALEEHPVAPVRASLLADLAVTEAVGRTPTAAARLDEAVAAQSSDTRRAEVLHAVGRALVVSGQRADAAMAFERGLELHASEEWDLLFGAALVNATRLHPQLREPIGRRVGELLGRASHGTTTAARAAWAELAFEMLLRNDPVAEVIACARRGLPGTGAGASDDLALRTAVGVLAFAGDTATAIDAVDAALGSASIAQSAAAVASLRFRRGQCRAFTGELVAARDDLEAALGHRAAGWGEFAAEAGLYLTEVLIELAHVDAAAALVDDIATDLRQHRQATDAAIIYARGRVRLAQRRAREALTDFQEAGRLAADVFGNRNPSVLAWRSGAAAAAHRMGATAAAEQLADDELRDARRFGEPRSLAHALRTAGRVKGGDDALAHLQEALDVVAGSPARLEHAYVLADLGGALRRAGRVAEAEQHLREAGDLADRLGAVTLGRMVREKLRLVGRRPRRLRVTGPGALTPSEVRVATLAAKGMTNREIAQELFVTLKAVEFHLGNTYRKLGITSRRQLPQALAQDD